jgi:ABC-type dipeptide/oligopeptide/nickel transport system ATPase component
MPNLTIQNKNIYYDGYLVKTLEDIKKTQLEKDGDCICIIDGKVGSGKSTFAQNLAAYIDNDFKVEQVCFDVEDFKKAIINSPKHKAIIFDEALGGLNIRRTMSGINVTLVQLLTEIRQKNLFIILCLPSIFDMDKTIAVQRTTFLVHVYTKNGDRGFFKFFGTKKKDKLVTNIYCKRNYQYCISHTFHGHFGDGYFVDEELYRKKKADVLLRYFGETKTEKKIDVAKKDSKKNFISDEELYIEEGKKFVEMIKAGKSYADIIREEGITDKTITRRINSYKKFLLCRDNTDKASKYLINDSEVGEIL